MLWIAGCLMLALPAPPDHRVTRYGAVPDDDRPDTQAIQAAIDACARDGGGTVRFPAGRFLSGGLTLKSGIRLVLEKDAVLQGTAHPLDYGQGQWGDALLRGENLVDVILEGPGTIDGTDCRNPKGEEGFRGPHAIHLVGCRKIAVRNLTLMRTGNYALLLRDCREAEFLKVTVRGGHDGIHAQACRGFRIADGDFRTGDDCLAGCDNEDFEVTGCRFNSSCNAFRLGCRGLLVRGCAFRGPGEFQHQVSKRTNMLSAFVHFAPRDRNPRLPSDAWLVEDCTIDNVDFVYGYDFERGLWQTGQPAKRLRFRNVRAAAVASPIRVLGDAERQFDLTLEGVTIALRKDREHQEVLDLERFGALTLKNVTLQNGGRNPVLRAREGNRVWLDRVICIPPRPAPYVLERVESVRTDPALDPAER